MKSITRYLFSRVALVALFMALQLGLLLAAVVYFRGHFAVFYALCVLVSVVVVVRIVSEEGNPAYKIAWLICIMILPIFGCLIYLTLGRGQLTEGRKRKMAGIQRSYGDAMRDIPSALPLLEERSPSAARQAAYLSRVNEAPVYCDTEARFLESGEAMYAAMLAELEKAEKYIFLEYFIIEGGEMWDSILDILRRKAAFGVDVRLIYDDFGCVLRVPADFDRRMEALGIRCRVFHRFAPVLSGSFNNRDHRKICVVDGRTAFTGGLNLADEYINRRELFGHWLDCGVMLRGGAARSFAAMFLSMWGYVSGESEDFAPFLPPPGDAPERFPGFTVPYTDTPLDNEPVGETAYRNMIERAESYVYLCTPYLVIDNELMTSLKAAAKSGVDVRLITPHIPDKRYVFAMTRSNYAPLVRAGVRVYEYTPGFIHSKTCVSDDKCAICGTINLDFRSLYLHFECAAWMYGTAAVADMKESYLKTLEQCQEISPAWCAARPWYARLAGSILRAFAPLA